MTNQIQIDEVNYLVAQKLKLKDLASLLEQQRLYFQHELAAITTNIKINTDNLSAIEEQITQTLLLLDQMPPTSLRKNLIQLLTYTPVR